MHTPTLLIKNADCVATMDDAGTEWRQASVLIQGPRIVTCGPTAELDPADGPFLVVDIGGRSTELGWGQGHQLQHASSYPLGSVGWAQAFFPDGTLSATAWWNL